VVGLWVDVTSRHPVYTVLLTNPASFGYVVSWSVGGGGGGKDTIPSPPRTTPGGAPSRDKIAEYATREANYGL
jgi:hypothetical protein